MCFAFTFLLIIKHFSRYVRLELNALKRVIHLTAKNIIKEIQLCSVVIHLEHGI